jgi:pimeloyl-ACP methyl ester carboxylesterase
MMRTLIIVLCLAAVPAFSQPLVAGRNTVDLRGQTQEIYYYPAKGDRLATALFLPGDGGWRGFAVDMAQALAASGIDIYGWDVKQYLSGFASSRTSLSERDIQADTATLAARLGATSSRRFVLIGWSQGAAMAALAGAWPSTQALLTGVVVLGLPESGVLGWRFADNLTYLTKGEPDEPKFATAPSLPAIAPLRFGMIHSTADEYVSAETAKRLFSLAREPKRLDLVAARNHRYDGKREEFFGKLKEQVKWAAGM